MKQVKVLELFGGIGAPRKALENLGFKVKSIDYVEWWKWPVKAYNRLFDNNYHEQDVKQWNLNIDLLVHGSPCQDFSNAGNQDLSTGRSLLYLRTLEIIEKELHQKPKYILWENVPGLVNKKNFLYFQHYLDTLEKLGYENFWKILNAKDFGIPQSRKRVFVVSIRNDLQQDFNWNNLETKTMAPLLNFINLKETSLSYFIKSQSMKKAVASGRIKIINDYANAITTKQDRWNNAGAIALPLKIKTVEQGKVKIADLTSFNNDNYVSLVESNNATIKTLQSNNRCKIAIPIKNEMLEIQENKVFSNFITLPRNSDGKVVNGAYNRYWQINNPSGYIGTISASNPLKIVVPIMKVSCTSTVKTLTPAIDAIPGIPIFIINDKAYHLRILTPKEAWLLMGFTNEDFTKVHDMPKTHLYHMAGNSIVVPVLEAIFKELLNLN